MTMAQRPTPYLVALAALISLRCEESLRFKSEDEFDLLFREEDTSDFSAVDALLQDHVLQKRSNIPYRRLQPKGNIQRLINALPSIHFQCWLKLAANSIDAFFDLIGTIKQSLQIGAVDAHSANGLLLRSVCEGLDDLEFHEIADLYQAFHDQVMANHDDVDDTYLLNELSDDDSEDLIRKECWSQNIFALPRPTTDLPSANMLRFQSRLQDKMRVMAIHALYQYMVQQVSEDILPFCSIVLAAMHNPNEPELMKQATDEAVRVAQQSQDASCLAFALGWLAKASNGNQDWMERCATRASEANLSTLAAGANLYLSLQALQTSYPTEAWSYWLRASSEPPNEESGEYQPTRLTSSAEECHYIIAKQKMVAAAIHEKFGSSDLSRIASISAIQCRKDISYVDAQIVAQNIARTIMFGSGAWKTADFNGGQLLESTEKSDRLTSDRPCIYANALETMISLLEFYDASLVRRKCGVNLGLIALEWSIMRGELLHAQSLLTSIQGQIDMNDDITIDIEQQRCLLLTRRGYWEDAIDGLKVLISKTEATKQAELLLQVAIHTIDSNSRGFADALNPLEECLQLCQLHAMSGLHSSALAVLAKVHLLMGDAARALTLLRSIMSSLLQSAHVWLQGDAYLTMAQALLRLGMQNAALKALVQSEELLYLCQDTRKLTSVYYLKARIYDTQQKIEKRDIAAEKFAILSNFLDDNGSVMSQSLEYLDLLGSYTGIKRLAALNGIEMMTKRPYPI